MHRSDIDSHTSFEPDLNGKTCVVMEKRTDHMIRMNYIRYVKTQFHEMRLKEEQQRQQQQQEGIEENDRVSFK